MWNQRNHFWFTPPFVVGSSLRYLTSAASGTLLDCQLRRDGVRDAALHRGTGHICRSKSFNAAQLPRATTVRLNVVPIVEAQCSAW
jgi:hypothetical protein